jgi:hypothetical protein
MAENKTKATDVDPREFIAAIPDPTRRADAEKLAATMERMTGEPPKMWGPTIVGFGSYTYKYDSGHGGTAARVGFAPRGKETVLYVVPGFEGKEDQLARLGKHRIGKCCLYIKKLADVDEGVLEEMIGDGLAYMDAKYPREA